jgi:hypothetical protein
MPNTEEDRIEFDQRNYEMSAIDVELSFAPDHHVPLYSQALLASYSQVYEFLKERPELVETIQTMGAAAVMLTDDERADKASTFRLAGYVRSGLLISKDVPVARYTAYAQTDFDAFEALYGNLIPTQEPEVVPEKIELVETAVEVEDDEEGSEEINALDILEHLERSGFDKPALALIKNGLEAVPATIDDLRKNDWEILKLSKDQYAEFLRQAPDSFRRAVKVLEEVSVAAKWKYEEVRKKVIYRFMIGNAAEQANAFDPRAGLKHLYGDSIGLEKLKDPLVQHKVQHPVKQTIVQPVPTEADEAPQFELGQVMAIIRNHINGGECRGNMLARSIADITKLSRLESRQILKALEADERIYRNGSKDGSPLYSLKKPDTDGKTAGTGTVEGAPANEKVELILLTEQESKTAAKIFQALIRLRYQSKGMILVDLANELEGEPEEIRIICSKLVRQELLITMQRHLQSGSPRAKKNRTATFFMFPTQQHWNEYKKDTTEYLSRMKLIEQTNAEAEPLTIDS